MYLAAEPLVPRLVLHLKDSLLHHAPAAGQTDLHVEIEYPVDVLTLWCQNPDLPQKHGCE